MKQIFKMVGAVTAMAFLAACGNTIPPISSTETTVITNDQIQDKDKAKRLFVGKAGGVLKFGNVEIEVPANAVADGTWFEVLRDEQKESNKLVFPNYLNNRTLYFINEVPKRKIKKSVVIKTNLLPESNPSILRFTDFDETESERDSDSKDSKSNIVHVFSNSRKSHIVQLAGTGRNPGNISMPGFLTFMEAIPESSSTRQFFPVSVSIQRYEATCIKKGGDFSPGWCALGINPPPPEKLENTQDFPNESTAGIPQSNSASIQPLAVSLGLRVLSWNVGNDDLIGCGFPGYKVKLCYLSDEIAVNNYLKQIWATPTRPDIILFQEVWHGRCAYVPDTDTGRVCGISSRKSAFTHQIKILLAGTTYSFKCATPRDTGTTWEDGYECIAIIGSNLSFLEGESDLFLGTIALRPLCAIIPMIGNPGVDTGFTATKVSILGASKPLTVITTHLAAPPYTGCRADQLAGLATVYGMPSPNQLLIGGDFNTEPFNDTTSGGQEYRRIFSQFGEVRDPTRLAYGIDDSRQITAAGKALDHVLSNLVSGSCSRLGSFYHTDHLRTVCELTGTYP